MKTRLKYAVGVLFLVVFTIAILNLRIFREHFSRDTTPNSRSICWNGEQSGTYLPEEKVCRIWDFENDMKEIRYPASKCLPGEIEKDYDCISCDQGYTFNGETCVIGDVAKYLRDIGLPAYVKCMEGCGLWMENGMTVCQSFDEKTAKKTKCPPRTKCPHGYSKGEDGQCRGCYIPALLSLVGDRCVSRVPTDVPAEPRGHFPCKAGEKQVSGLCFDACPAGKKFYMGFCTSMDIKTLEEDEVNIDTPLEVMGCPEGCSPDGRRRCIKNGGTDECVSTRCPAGQTLFMGVCVKDCPAGKKLDSLEKLCVLDPNASTKKDEVKKDEVKKDEDKKDEDKKDEDETNYVMYGLIGVVAVIIIGGIVFMARSSPAPGYARGAKRRSN